jgi:crossover junction endodeoxyribonuclease RuvC
LNRNSEIILGIDPGTIVLGYGIIQIEKNKPKLLEMGVLKLSKYKDANVRLQMIYNKIGELNRAFKPTQFAIEAPFFGKNVQSMLKLGRAQGVAIAAAMQALLFKDEPEFLDATDAVAVALCHYYQSNSIGNLGVKANGWESFLKNNAHRIKK